ncbi:MAG: SWIM zinc finger family protein, partial [Kiritimatiellae bacterium]|nr:SWIM zinc finger family protein [Kiritimatiellia bacterium]
ALSGQVASLRIEGPLVSASVVGARPEPYRVDVAFRTPDEAARARIVAKLRAEPMLVARLLADDLPAEVEAMFRLEGLDLFPGGRLAPRTYDVTTQCSCPDYANPCKHVAAVLLILGEEVARRPLTLLELRGIAAEELFDGE